MTWQMRAVGAFVRLTRSRAYASEAGGEGVLRCPKKDPSPPRSVRRRCTVEDRTVGGYVVPRVRPASWSPRAGTGSGPALVYLHGGAYVNEIAPQHWSIVADLAEGTGREVLVPLYGLAPDHDALDAHALVAGVLAGLADEGRTAYLVGDSAGGGLALAAAQVAAQDRPGTVVGLTLVAPWLDLSLSNPAIAELERHDPWLARAGLRPIARAWAGDLPHDDPRVSPLAGDLTGLPPLDVLVGTRDITLADCRVLAQRLATAPATGPVPHRVVETPGAIHVHPLLPVPEARPARAAIVERVRAVLDGACGPDAPPMP